MILSFENHCNRAQQYKLAKYCDDIFGDLLLKEPLPEHPVSSQQITKANSGNYLPLFFQLEPGVPLPPPSALKRKILIKNKRMKPEVEKVELELFLKGELKIDENEPNEDASATKAPPAEAPPPEPVAATPDAAAAPGAEGAEGAEGAGGEAAAANYTGSTTNVHPLLSSFVNYAQPVKFQAFDISLRKQIIYRYECVPSFVL